MNQKIDYVDALRGIAILAVILVHAGFTFGLVGAFAKITVLGAKGVQLFYFISAFTLFLSYNAREQQEQFSVTNFYIRRFFRIAPLYYIAIIYYSILLYFDQGIITSWTELILNVTFTHGFSPLYINHLVPGGWSIAVEMSFYSIVPFLLYKITTINKAVLFVCMALIIRFIFLYYFKLHPVSSNTDIHTGYLYWFLPNQLPCFAVGILFYFIAVDKGKEETNRLRASYRIIAFAFLVSLLCVVDQMFMGWNFFSWDFFFCLVFFVVALVLTTKKTSLFVNKFTTLSGKYSYSMYITHPIVLFWLKKIETQLQIVYNKALVTFFMYYLLVVVVSILLSILSFKLIELPTQLLGKNIINKRERKQVVTAK